MIIVKCDICKKKMETIVDRQEMVCIESRAGYGSVFGDGLKIEIDMCQECFKEKLGEWVRVNES